MGRLQLFNTRSDDFDTKVGFAILIQCCFVRLTRDFSSIEDTGDVLRKISYGTYMILLGQTTNIVSASIL